MVRPLTTTARDRGRRTQPVAGSGLICLQRFRAAFFNQSVESADRLVELHEPLKNALIGPAREEL